MVQDGVHTKLREESTMMKSQLQSNSTYTVVRSRLDGRYA